MIQDRGAHIRCAVRCRPRIHHLYPDAGGSLPEVMFQPAEFPEIKATPEISATGAGSPRQPAAAPGAVPRPVSGKPYF
jgi:hypothetical protein